MRAICPGHLSSLNSDVLLLDSAVVWLDGHVLLSVVPRGAKTRICSSSRPIRHPDQCTVLVTMETNSSTGFSLFQTENRTPWSSFMLNFTRTLSLCTKYCFLGTISSNYYSSSYCSFALQSWRWTQNFTPNHYYMITRLYGATTQKSIEICPVFKHSMNLPVLK